MYNLSACKPQKLGTNILGRLRQRLILISTGTINRRKYFENTFIVTAILVSAIVSIASCVLWLNGGLGRILDFPRCANKRIAELCEVRLSIRENVSVDDPAPKKSYFRNLVLMSAGRRNAEFRKNLALWYPDSSHFLHFALANYGASHKRIYATECLFVWFMGELFIFELPPNNISWGCSQIFPNDGEGPYCFPLWFASTNNFTFDSVVCNECALHRFQRSPGIHGLISRNIGDIAGQISLVTSHQDVDENQPGRYFCPKQLLLIVGCIIALSGFIFLFKVLDEVYLNPGFNVNVAIGGFFAAAILVWFGGMIILYMLWLVF
jgi:hypothetical protein